MSKKIDAHVLQRYRVGELIGSGAYGHVWRAEDKTTSQPVALKKVFGAFRNNIDAQRTYRQVQILQHINHPNIIRLYRVMGAANKQDLYLIFQLMEADLLAVVGSNILSPAHQKYILFQLLKGIAHLHHLQLIHRDLKPSNVLLDSSCRVKVCDFGLVRSLAVAELEHPVLSEEVATKWYRAPELLLGSRSYSYPADMWSVGCIAAELLIGRPLFQGKSVLAQLQKIMEFTGLVGKEDLESLDSPVVQCLVTQIHPKIKLFSDYFSLVNPQFFPLLKGLLKFNPHKRLTALQTLNLDLFAQFMAEKPPEDDSYALKAIVPQLDDNHRFKVGEYRKEIYSSIPKQLRGPLEKKTSLHLAHEKSQSKGNVKEGRRVSKTVQEKGKKIQGEGKQRAKSSKAVSRGLERKKSPQKQFLKIKKEHHKSTPVLHKKNKMEPYKSEIAHFEGLRESKANILRKFQKKAPQIKKHMKKIKIQNRVKLS